MSSPRKLADRKPQHPVGAPPWLGFPAPSPWGEAARTLLGARREELPCFMATNGICSSPFKDDDKGNQTVRDEDRWGARCSQRGIPRVGLAAVIYIPFVPADSEQGAGQRGFTKPCAERSDTEFICIELRGLLRLL